MANPVSVFWLSHETFSISYTGATGSMRPYIEGGEHVLVDSLTIRFRDLERGDVVTLTQPIGGETEHLLKRVVGLPGEEVRVWQGTVFIDGEPLDEPYVEFASFASARTTQLGDDEVWVMGDNRRGSYDSADFGPVPLDAIDGRVVTVTWPPERASTAGVLAELTLSPLALIVIGSAASTTAIVIMMHRRKRSGAWALFGVFFWGAGVLLAHLLVPHRRAETALRAAAQEAASAEPDQPSQKLLIPLATLSVALLPATLLVGFGGSLSSVEPAFALVVVAAALGLAASAKLGAPLAYAVLVGVGGWHVTFLIAYGITGDSATAFLVSLAGVLAPGLLVRMVLAASFPGRQMLGPQPTVAQHVAGAAFWAVALVLLAEPTATRGLVALLLLVFVEAASDRTPGRAATVAIATWAAVAGTAILGSAAMPALEVPARLVTLAATVLYLRWSMAPHVVPVVDAEGTPFAQTRSPAPTAGSGGGS